MRLRKSFIGCEHKGEERVRVRHLNRMKNDFESEHKIKNKSSILVHKDSEETKEAALGFAPA